MLHLVLEESFGVITTKKALVDSIPTQMRNQFIRKNMYYNYISLPWDNLIMSLVLLKQHCLINIIVINLYMQ